MLCYGRYMLYFTSWWSLFCQLLRLHYEWTHLISECVLQAMESAWQHSLASHSFYLEIDTFHLFTYWAIGQIEQHHESG